MLLPYKLLVIELRRNDCFKFYIQYERHLCKVENNVQRINFLENCKKADIIPKFLKFRIPNNGCFQEEAVHQFQKKLLHQEIVIARDNIRTLRDKAVDIRKAVVRYLPVKCLSSVLFHTRLIKRETGKKVRATHNEKLQSLSVLQEKPLLNVKNTVRVLVEDLTPPSYVLETLTLGPKHAILDRFDPKAILVEIDGFLSDCKKKSIPEETINDINFKTLNYIKHCKQMKESRNIAMTKKYLKDNKLLAVPFDKGIGICIMSVDTYQEKMDTILNLPQFEKLVITRKNAKNPIIKEQERVTAVLKEMKDDKRISDTLYEKLRPVGSQPARLYGLAKVHKANTPMRPVLSMPGSAYAKIGKQVALWLSKVPECNINASTQLISDAIKNLTLPNTDELISFDVSSLYTNVPVMESINTCADLLFNQYSIAGVSKATFIELAQLASCNVLMSTHNGYYIQKDGLAMGSPPAPHLANGWMSQFDKEIQDESKIYYRYMDDIIMNIDREQIGPKLEAINNLHEDLHFTMERERDNTLPFLDMQLINSKGVLSSKWYRKPTDTGLIMNYHSLAPKRYKTSVVAGFVHRIYRACSSWILFHDSLEEAKKVLESNQYPPSFYEPIINKALSKIVSPPEMTDTTEEEKDSEPFLIFLNYRGKCSEDYARDLYAICNDPHKIITPNVRVVFTISKLKSSLPQLKQPVNKMFRSGVVYQIKCPGCQACYVGQSVRHLQTRFREHINLDGPLKLHLAKCAARLTEDDIEILGSSTRNEQHLLTLEALFIRDTKPKLNTKEEYKSRALIIRS